MGERACWHSSRWPGLTFQKSSVVFELRPDRKRKPCSCSMFREPTAHQALCKKLGKALNALQRFLSSSFFCCCYKFIYFIYLFLAVLGLCCCAWAFSSYGERGLLFVAVCELLITVASHCGARALGARASVVAACGLSSCGSRAYLLCGMWDLPGPGIKPVSPALAGGLSTTAPPGKPLFFFFFNPLGNGKLLKNLDHR